MTDSTSPDQDIEQHYAQLNKLFEHRTRLSICALLCRYDKIAFARFKELLKESDGNLGAQLRKLEDVKYLTVNKEFLNRRPISWYSITPLGRKALKSHLENLSAIVEG